MKNSHRKLTKLITRTTLPNSMKLEPHHVGPPKMDVSWWRVLIKCGPLEKGIGKPLQYSCLENPIDGGAWWATVHGVAKSQTRLSAFTFTFKLW